MTCSPVLVQIAIVVVMLGNWQTSECKSWLLAVLLAVAVTPHGHHILTHTQAHHNALNWVFGYSKVAQSDESWRRHPNIQTSFSSSFSSSRATCRRIVASSFVALLFLLHSLVYTVGQTATGRGSRAGHRRDSKPTASSLLFFPTHCAMSSRCVFPLSLKLELFNSFAIDWATT